MIGVRVTNLMMVNDLKRNINTNMERLAKYQEQLSTGRKLNKLSDDPSGLVKVMRLRTNITQNEQYLRNIGDAVNFMETVDSSLNDLNQVLQRIRDLTVEVSNSTNDDGAKQAVAEELQTLRDHLKMVANNTYGSKYIFAGSNVSVAPCGDTEWKGNSNNVEAEIGPGVVMEINIDMTSFFGNPSGVDELGNPDGGIFAAIDVLLEDINNGTADDISANLDNLDAKIDDLLFKRATIGARINRMELQENRLENTNLSLTDLLANYEDADLAEVSMNLQMQENVYTASLAAGAKIIQPTLVDFLS